MPTPPNFDRLQFLARFFGMPALPNKWRRSYFEDVTRRANKRIASLADRVDGVRAGRTMPEPNNIAIGSGRHFQLAVLFLDVTGFTTWPSATVLEQKRILWIMDVFMAEMMSIIRDHGGTFEKNTGDGVMAYFGTEATTAREKVRPAVEAAVLMHYVNDVFVSPWLTRDAGLWPVKFRIGIDYGEVTIAKIGVHGTNSFVAIGASANVANRLLSLVQEGIAIGNEVFFHLPDGWAGKCEALPPRTGYEYRSTGQPYPAWELKHRILGHPLL